MVLFKEARTIHINVAEKTTINDLDRNKRSQHTQTPAVDFNYATLGRSSNEQHVYRHMLRVTLKYQSSLNIPVDTGATPGVGHKSLRWGS